MAGTVQGVRNVDMTDEFRNIDDARIQCVLDDQVSCYVNATQWGTCADLACELVAAHLLAMALGGTTGPTGPVTSESAGGLSVSYGSAPMASGDGFWSSTSFGQRYLQLASTRPTTPLTLTANIAVTAVVP